MRAIWKTLKIEVKLINPFKLHKGTLQLHVYHIKGKIIEGSLYSATTNDNQQATINSLKIQFNKSLLSTEIVLKMNFMCG